MDDENPKSGNATEETTADNPGGSDANSEPAKADDSGIGIGDKTIDSGDEQSAEELKEQHDADPTV